MSDSFSKDFKDAIDDVAVSIRKGYKKIKSNKQVKDFTKKTTNAFDDLGKELEKGINDLTGKKSSKTEKKTTEEKVVENVDYKVTNEDKNPVEDKE